MTLEEKELLLKDICARLPYGVMVSVKGGEFDSYNYPYLLTAISKFGLESFCRMYHPIYTPFGAPKVEDVKPYLRPMSSMTEEENKEYAKIVIKSQDCSYANNESATTMVNDWYLSKGFDVRGLIPKGLALEAPEGMYKTE